MPTPHNSDLFMREAAHTDLSLSEESIMELETFREETRDWLESNCPQEMRLGAIHFEDAYELYRTAGLPQPGLPSTVVADWMRRTKKCWQKRWRVSRHCLPPPAWVWR